MIAQARYTPCEDCPFRKDITFPLTPERVTEITNSFIHEDRMFPCHKTVDYDKFDDDGDGLYVFGGTELWCAGSLRMLEANDPKRNVVYRLMLRYGDYDPDRLNRDIPCFETVDEMVERMRELQQRGLVR